MDYEGKYWDSLTEGERRVLLAFAGIWKSDEIVFHEATLKWNQLLPSTQDKITERLAGEKKFNTHVWMDSSQNNCCSCGWRCSFNSTGMHREYVCRQAHKAHIESYLSPLTGELHG